MQRGQLRWRPNAAGATAVEAECGGGRMQWGTAVGAECSGGLRWGPNAVGDCGGGRMQWGTAVVEVGFVLMGYPGFTSPLLRFHFLA
jgi:hypothetical protein